MLENWIYFNFTVESLWNVSISSITSSTICYTSMKTIAQKPLKTFHLTRQKSGSLERSEDKTRWKCKPH